MNTADPTLDTRIQAFAAAVRARLADLDPEDVDDLTGGLEADLQEEAADHDGALEPRRPRALRRRAAQLGGAAGARDRDSRRLAAAPAPGRRPRADRGAARADPCQPRASPRSSTC
ncbi:hypothetical protein [Clavibacter tessellarius]|uniref:hypothetical protein n=1 Tax=Clavibacter tessellarius TaxID=31965 RepID=UPI00324DDEFC